MSSAKAKVRCAIYTRKSTEEGLDQEFNSLDAQYEACEAFIRSQAGEGWRALPARYDVGGYSGGNLNRPAMQQLLADIDASKVDVIVVYKVDRLTRSLVDFAKIVERLDTRGVSFVSVTQAFNSTTSMGRLTLNVLLSFAQFEREVTGERIRDKIAASKAKGIWMGGNIPFGYDLHERRLVVKEPEAKQVRHIFTRYLDLGSGVALMKELHRDGILSKRRISLSGKEHGGQPFSCGALYYLLQNRLYLGEIVHRGAVHQGEHNPIVGKQLFNAVQVALAENRRKRREAPKRADQSWLAGLARDSDGKTMTTSFSYGRGGRLYRYYVSGSLDPCRPDCSKSARRVPAAPLERLVLRTLFCLFQRNLTFEDVLPLLDRVELRDRSVQIVVDAGALLEPHEPAAAATARLRPHIEPHRLAIEGKLLFVIVDRQPVFRGGRANGGAPHEPAMNNGIALLRSAHRLLREHSMSPTEQQEHRQAKAPSWQRQRRIMTLGLLAPTIQKAILNGVVSCPTEGLAAAPLAWADQLVGFIGEARTCSSVLISGGPRFEP